MAERCPDWGAGLMQMETTIEHPSPAVERVREVEWVCERCGLVLDLPPSVLRIAEGLGLRPGGLKR